MSAAVLRRRARLHLVVGQVIGKLGLVVTASLIELPPGEVLCLDQVGDAEDGPQEVSTVEVGPPEVGILEIGLLVPGNFSGWPSGGWLG